MDAERRGSPATSFPNRLARAQQGDAAALGNMLERYRGYLEVLAAARLDKKLRRRFSPSDVVQETMLHASRDIADFRGDNETRFQAWLRRILLHRLHEGVARHVLAERRDVRREVRAARSGSARSDMRRAAVLATREPTPSQQVAREEDRRDLAEYIARLPASYRRVLILRNFEGLGFDEIAARMQRSSGAARMLWLRAVERLRTMMRRVGEHEPS